MGPHKNRRRMRPAPQGRAYREQRHYCHITVLVSSEKPEVKEKVKPKKQVKAVKVEETATAKAPAKKTTAKKTTKKAENTEE